MLGRRLDALQPAFHAAPHPSTAQDPTVRVAPSWQLDCAESRPETGEIAHVLRGAAAKKSAGETRTVRQLEMRLPDLTQQSLGNGRVVEPAEGVLQRGQAVDVALYASGRMPPLEELHGITGLLGRNAHTMKLLGR